MNLSDTYILNPSYILRNDKTRALITDNEDFESLKIDVNRNFVSIIHPIHAMMLSFFNGDKNLKLTIQEIAIFFDLSFEVVLKIIEEYIENKKEINFNFEDNLFQLPKNILIRKKNNIKNIEKYIPEDFNITSDLYDFQNQRLNIPLSVTLMMNNVCYTDCIYCYADRRIKKNNIISIDIFKKIINEARILKFKKFDINGGELFLFKNWFELINELRKNGFKPLISTKVPINEDIILKLKSLNINKIQISLDTLDIVTSIKLLKVSDEYIKKIKETLNLLEKHKIKIDVHTVLTSYNENIENIEYIYQYLSTFSNILKWTLTPAGYSLYKSEQNYLNLKPSLTNIKKIKNALNLIYKKKSNFEINFSGYNEEHNYNNSVANKNKDFSNRAKCTANIDNFYILADGKVTICEELYWHPKFLIGDIKKQSLLEVWNSKKAIQLYKLQKEYISKTSACKTCNSFHECREGNGVCWKDVLIAYGYDNWDFPDPRCPKSPKVEKIVWIN